uniref:Uncharacterized protein n=1 Tax=Tanacetum cinerariifolium TaxID=118510 RepID=A0A699JHU0_TANCI|nr:hypothetical protein [Tanacetum cinerariifolium]
MGHIIKNCPMKKKEHVERTKKPGNIGETATLANKEIMTAKPTTARVLKQEHNLVLDIPTKIVEEGKEYTCLASHQCDVAEIKAPNMEAANRKGKKED